MLDVLCPKIELQLKSWGNIGAGEQFSEVTSMLRSKLRAYIQAVVEKLVENVSERAFIYLLGMYIYS